MHICKRNFLISSKNKTNHFLLVACIWLKISELWLFYYYFLWFKIDFQDFLIKMNQYVNFHKNLRTCPKKMFRFPCRKTAAHVRLCKLWVQVLLFIFIYKIGFFKLGNRNKYIVQDKIAERRTQQTVLRMIGNSKKNIIWFLIVADQTFRNLPLIKINGLCLKIG